LIAYLEEYVDNMDGNIYRVPGHPAGLSTKEGPSAVYEAIEFCRSAEPVGPLEWNQLLHEAAKSHCDDTGPKGMTGHDSSNGDDMSRRVERFGDWGGTIGENCSYGNGDALKMVAQLFMDDGVASRGHRTNIMKPEFKVCGAAIGYHEGYEQMSVQDFAGSFVEKGSQPDRGGNSDRGGN